MPNPYRKHAKEHRRGGSDTAGVVIEETDGSPSVKNVTKIKVSVGDLTDNGDGSVTLNTGGAAGGAHALTDVNNTVSGRTAGDLLIATAATTYGFAAMSGDATITSAGVVTVAATHAGSAHHAAITLGTDADVLLGLTGQQIDLDTQTANTVFAGPATGGAVDPTFRALVVADMPANGKIRAIVFNIDGGGSAITTGIKAYLHIPFGCTINAVSILSDAAPTGTNLVLDIKKVAYVTTMAGFTSIVAAAPPTLTTTNRASKDTTLTGWTTAITADDMLEISVTTAPGTTTFAVVTLKVTES